MTKNHDLSFIHRFVPATASGRTPLLLLHGTGGDENDMLGLGGALLPGAALLSPRGQVLEHGVPRFFRRLAEGIFDEDDLKTRAAELAGFIDDARTAYDLPAPIAVGFSNGANIAAALLLLHRKALAGAILLRAMAPFRAPVMSSPADAEHQNGVPVLVLSGAMDPIVPADNAARLVGSLRAAGHAVEHDTLPAGHNLSQADLTLAKRFLESQFAGSETV